MSTLVNVSTAVASGNACVLAVESGGDLPEVHFTPSPMGGPEAMWFCFELTAATDPPPAGIRCVMHLVDNLLGGGDGRAGFHPVFKTAQQEWTRVAAVEGDELPDGRPVVSWTVPGDQGPVCVALCYPYAAAEREALERDLTPAFRSDVVAVTQENRPLCRLSNDPGQAEAARPGIYCFARQHAGETPGSWVLDGLLRAMAAAGDKAPLVWAVPMVDLDGVLAGQYGKDRYPWDFNRAWGSQRYPQAMLEQTGTHAMRYETHCLQNDLLRWKKRCKPLMVLDFHAPAMCEQDGIYCYVRHLGEDGRPDAGHRPWVEAFQAAVDGQVAATAFARTGKYRSRWETARISDFVNEALNLPAVTFEVPYACTRQTLLTRESYQHAGQRLAEAIVTRLQADAAACAPTAAEQP
ncbi:MAG: hypothetical protein WD534_04070 [Phycisphaeraceae bacterium]